MFIFRPVLGRHTREKMAFLKGTKHWRRRGRFAGRAKGTGHITQGVSHEGQTNLLYLENLRSPENPWDMEVSWEHCYAWCFRCWKIICFLVIEDSGLQDHYDHRKSPWNHEAHGILKELLGCHGANEQPQTTQGLLGKGWRIWDYLATQKP